MEKLRTLTLTLLLVITAGSNAMVNLTAQRPWEPRGAAMPLFSLGVMHQTPFERHYFETGVMVRPVQESAVIGTYGGYYYTIWPIFRPGLILGMSFRKKDNWKSSLYYGIALQGGVLTFVVTGQGIGGGVNIPLKTSRR